MNTPDGPDRYRGYVPALTCVVVPFDNSAKPWVASGFLLEGRAGLYFVTAGHALAELKRGVAAKACSNIRLVDGFASSAIPIDMAQALCAVDDDSSGMDFGFLLLNSNQADNLRASSRFRCFAPDDIIKLNSLVARRNSLGEIKIIGYPRAWTSYGPAESTPAGIRVPVYFRAIEIPVGEFGTGNLFGEYVARAPAGFFDKSGLFAHVSLTPGVSTDQIDDIEGVSGGPVLADDNGRLSVIGIQVAWLASLRIIRFIPIGDVRLRIDRT